MKYEEYLRRNYASLSSFYNEDGSLKREDVLSLLLNEEYGRIKEVPYTLEFEVKKKELWACGNIEKSSIIMHIHFDSCSVEIPFLTFVPTGLGLCPAFLYISFVSQAPNELLPVEEICDNGYEIITFCCEDVAKDADDDFSGELEKILIGTREGNTAGKLSLWSTAASMIMDYVMTMDTVDKDNIAIIGHSRLGKVSLLTGAKDERFKYTIVNESGCSGAALSLEKKGESIRMINSMFPNWLAINYRKYNDKEAYAKFDQHFMLALVAPRFLYVASAAGDEGADPDGEYISCVLADEAYKKLGKKGFIHPARDINPGEYYMDGDIGYHKRAGQHFLGRYDWQMFMKFIKSKI